MTTDSPFDSVPETFALQEQAPPIRRAGSRPGANSLAKNPAINAFPAQSIRTAELIGVDWGTTNLRVMRIGHEGQILDLRHDERGASKLHQSEFGPILREVAGDWLDETKSVLVCGMAGARDGWRETGYRECPVTLKDLSPLDISSDGLAIAIVPGVSLVSEGALVDVMRGEETQFMGLDDCNEGALIVTPGTHSKWIRCDRGAIASFRSFLTGDLFAAIRAETLLGHEMGDAGSDQQAFEDGVRRALDDNALTAILFSVRTARLSGRIPATSTADYLSGLLIGAEVAAQNIVRDDPIVVLGTSALCARYASALTVAGARNVKTTDATVAVAKGLWRINRARQ